MNPSRARRVCARSAVLPHVDRLGRVAATAVHLDRLEVLLQPEAEVAQRAEAVAGERDQRDVVLLGRRHDRLAGQLAGAHPAAGRIGQVRRHQALGVERLLRLVGHDEVAALRDGRDGRGDVGRPGEALPLEALVQVHEADVERRDRRERPERRAGAVRSARSRRPCPSAAARGAPARPARRRRRPRPPAAGSRSPRASGTAAHRRREWPPWRRSSRCTGAPDAVGAAAPAPRRPRPARTGRSGRGPPACHGAPSSSRSSSSR